MLLICFCHSVIKGTTVATILGQCGPRGGQSGFSALVLLSNWNAGSAGGVIASLNEVQSHQILSSSLDAAVSLLSQTNLIEKTGGPESQSINMEYSKY